MVFSLKGGLNKGGIAFNYSLAIHLPFLRLLTDTVTGSVSLIKSSNKNTGWENNSHALKIAAGIL